MAKFLLLSPILFTILLPTLAANRDPERGMPRATGLWLLFSVCFMVAMRFIYPRIL